MLLPSVLVLIALLCSDALASIVNLDFSSKNPQSIDPSQLEGLYLMYHGKDMKPGKHYISLEQLPKHTRVLKEREMYTREIRHDRLTIFVNSKGKIIKAGAFK